ncbi:MAG: B12-binding domain-containing radical SAM protein [Clostridia bacterium]|nr:B12-binding domain-containing radical SAM protein [Clostridia bacterium]
MAVTATIVAINSKYVHSSLAPWCLLASVESPAKASVVEGTINEPQDQLLNRILATKPDLVAFSCYIWNINCVSDLLPLLRKKLPQVRILLGGPEVSYRAENVLSTLNADYVLSGEGEEPFSRFLNQFPDPSGIGGLSYRTDSGLVIAEPYLTEEIPQSPYTPEYFSALKGRIAYLETSRGCPFSCAFCLSGRCGKPRFYPMERAKEELLLLANSGSKTVKLVDRTFNANPKRAYELWSFLLDQMDELPPDVCFHFEIGGDLLDEDSLNLLSRFPAGRIQLEIGLQSFSEQTLQAVCRKTDNERLKENIRRLVAMGNMHIHIDLIAGLPHEDYSTFGESFNTAFALRPQMLQLGFLKLIYGSKMREEPKTYPCTYSKNAPYEVQSTPWLSEEELARLHLIEDILERMYNSGRFTETVEYLLKATDFTPFMLFERIADQLGALPAGTTLDRFTEMLLPILLSFPCVEKDLLRDALVTDRLSTDASGRVPLCLDPKDERIGPLRHLLDEDSNTRRPGGIRRGMVCLKSKPYAIYADYVKPHPVTGRYPLTFISFATDG